VTRVSLRHGPVAVAFLIVAVLILGSLTAFVGAAALSGASSARPENSGVNAPGTVLPFETAQGPAGLPTAVPMVHPAAGEGGVVSTIDLVSNRTLPGDAGVAVEIYPEYAVFDSNNGQLYLRNSIDSETPLGALNTTSDRMEADIATPGGMIGDWIAPTMAVDTQTGYVYATNALDPGNVSVINGTTDEITASIPVGYAPDGIVFDAVNHDFYVANAGSHNVTVLSGATNQVVKSIQVGSGPTSVMLNPVDDQILVANFGAGNVSVINASTNTLYKSVTIGPQTRAFPLGFAFDSTNDYVDVLNESFGGDIGNVTVLDAASGYSVVSILKLGLGSDSLAWDPATDELFVANGLSENVSVFQQPGDTFVKSIPVGYQADEQCIVYDPVDQDIYVANPASLNVSVIAPSSGVVATISLGHGSENPLALAVSPTTGDVYSINEGEAQIAPTVTIIAPTTHKVLDTIKTATYPEGFTYEAAGNTIAIANDGGNDTYFINATNYRVESTAPAGVMPQGVAYDPYSQLTYTLSPESLNVTVLNSAHQRVATLSAEYDPESILYDPGTGDVYVTHLDENITVINGSAHDSIASFFWHSSNPYDMVYDSHNHDVYVTNEIGTNVSIIAPGTATGVFEPGVIQVGYNPSDLAFDSQNNTVWVSNLGGATKNLTVINDTTQEQVESVILTTNPDLIAYDPANNAIYSDPAYPDEVVAYNASTYQLLPGGPIVYSAVEGNLGSVGYDPATGALLVTQMNTGAVYVIGPVSAASYPVSFVESGLPPTTTWSVTFNGSFESSATTAINFASPNDTDLPFTVGTVAGYFANVSSGVVTVAGHSVTIYIGFSRVNSVFAVNFQESGLPPTTLWAVTLNGTADSSHTNTISFEEANHTGYSFTVGGLAGYNANVTSGAVTVDGIAQTVYIGFTPVPVYTVDFVETGLPATTPWSITLNGTENSSTTATVGFVEPNGTDYPYSVGSVAGYVPNALSGAVTVAGRDQTVNITYIPAGSAYGVTFVDPGLPTGTMWEVTLNGSRETTTNATVEFSEPNGTYPFTIGTPNGYRATPSTGNVTVDGTPVSTSIVFAAVTTPFSATLTAIPATIGLGASTTLNTSTDGGTAPLSYTYTNLPAGCVTASLANLVCAPTATGNFTVTVTVTDHNGNTTQAHATLTVQSSAVSPPSSNGTSWEWVVLAVVLAVVVLLLIFLAARRRKKPAETPSGGTPPTSDPSAPPSSDGPPPTA
jgi:YVTN family beta-propeller protein